MLKGEASHFARSLGKKDTVVSTPLLAVPTTTADHDQGHIQTKQTCSPLVACCQWYQRLAGASLFRWLGAHATQPHKLFAVVDAHGIGDGVAQRSGLSRGRPYGMNSRCRPVGIVLPLLNGQKRRACHEGK